MRGLQQWMAVALVALSVTCALIAPAARAVEPDEVLPDAAMEQRARDISEGLRCLVCRNESIDESNADLARDLRLLVRERLVAGDTDTEVVDYIVDRFGEYVLLKPQTDGANLILWLAGPFMALLAIGLGVAYMRNRALAKSGVDQDLTPEEAARLAEIMKD